MGGDIDDDNELTILLLLLLRRRELETDNDDENDAVSNTEDMGGVGSFAGPLLSSGDSEGGMAGFPTLLLETEFIVAFLDDVTLFTNTLLMLPLLLETLALVSPLT